MSFASLFTSTLAVERSSFPPVNAPSTLGPPAVQVASDAFRQGRLVMLIDDAHPERGALVVASAERTSDDIVAFMANQARGLVGLALLPHRVEQLGLELQGAWAEEGRENYTVSIEAREGVTTGISAGDRARTIQVAASPFTGADDLVTPGHIFPMLTDIGGVVARRGWAEAAVDLARIAGLSPAASTCHVLDEHGELACGAVARGFAKTHGLAVLTLEQLIAHRMVTESFVSLLTQATVPTPYGDFVARVFLDNLKNEQHLVLSVGEVRTADAVLTRLHSECLTGDVFGSRRCDCGGQLDQAMRQIAKEGRGVVLYLRQEGRGIGLVNKVRAYALQDAGQDTVEANLALGLPVDQRGFGLGAQMLHAIGVTRVALLTNNPRKIEELERFGVVVARREQLEVDPVPDAVAYLRTKKEKLGHLLTKV